jgi:hypothetical protein
MVTTIAAGDPWGVAVGRAVAGDGVDGFDGPALGLALAWFALADACAGLAGDAAHAVSSSAVLTTANAVWDLRGRGGSVMRRSCCSICGMMAGHGN